MSFFFLLVYLFFAFMRPQDWMPFFYEKPIIDTLAITMLVFLTIERLGSRENIFIRVPQNMLMIGFFVAIVMSHVVHTYLEGLILAWQAFLINFVLYLLLLNGINSVRKFKIALWFIVFLISILVPQGIYQLQHGYGWAHQGLTFDFHRNEYRINWIGIFNDPNDLALTFMIAVGIVLAFSFGKTSFFIRIINWGLLPALIYGIYLTNSRGGLLALMATVFFYFVKRTKKFVLGGIIGVAAAVALFAFGPSRTAIISTQEASANTRVELWYQGILMMKSNPLFGVGYGRFTEDVPQTAHNSYILAGSELGILGLFFWVGLIYISFKGLSIIQKNDEGLRTYAYGLQAGLVGFCSAAFFLSRTYIILPYLLFALSGSLMHLAKIRNKDLDFSFSRKDVKTTFLWCAGIIGVTYVIIKITL